MPTGSWMQAAGCRDLPTAWWYDGRAALQATALSICSRCAVRHDCLQAALAEETRATDRYGIRGGLLAAERATSGSVAVRLSSIGGNHSDGPLDARAGQRPRRPLH